MKSSKSFVLFFACLFFLSSAVFAQTGGLKGKIRNSKGDGLPDVSVTVRREGADAKSVRSDAKGNFVMDGLQTGSYNLVFEASGYGAGVLYNVEVKKDKVRDLGDRLILTVDQGTQVIVKGSVFNQDGRSVTGAKVEMERLNADGTTRKIGSVYTNVSGEFTFRQAEGANKFRVTATLKDATASKEVEVSMAAVYRLAITLDIQK